MIDFEPLNAACLDAFAKTVTFVPLASGEDEVDVVAIDFDPPGLPESDPGPLIRLFLSLESSGMPREPLENEHFRIGSTLYRAFKVTPDKGKGVYVSLTK